MTTGISKYLKETVLETKNDLDSNHIHMFYIGMGYYLVQTIEMFENHKYSYQDAKNLLGFLLLSIPASFKSLRNGVIGSVINTTDTIPLNNDMDRVLVDSLKRIDVTNSYDFGGIENETAFSCGLGYSSYIMQNTLGDITASYSQNELDSIISEEDALAIQQAVIDSICSEAFSDKKMVTWMRNNGIALSNVALNDYLINSVSNIIAEDCNVEADFRKKEEKPQKESQGVPEILHKSLPIKELLFSIKTTNNVKDREYFYVGAYRALVEISRLMWRVIKDLDTITFENMVIIAMEVPRITAIRLDLFHQLGYTEGCAEYMPKETFDKLTKYLGDEKEKMHYRNITYKFDNIDQKILLLSGQLCMGDIIIESFKKVTSNELPKAEFEGFSHYLNGKFVDLLVDDTEINTEIYDNIGNLSSLENVFDFFENFFEKRSDEIFGVFL